jgi:hypothetical protein
MSRPGASNSMQMHGAASLPLVAHHVHDFADEFDRVADVLADLDEVARGDDHSRRPERRASPPLPADGLPRRRPRDPAAREKVLEPRHVLERRVAHGGEVAHGCLEPVQPREEIEDA